MNRIFKVIWSKTRNCYVVASELAKGRTKAASTGDKAKRLALAAITALMLLPVGGYSYAADTTTVTAKDGTEQTVYTQEGTDSQIEAARKYTYRKAAELDQKLTDQKTSTALHVTQAGNLIVGTKENQIVRDLKINGQLTAGSLSTGDIVSSGDVTVTGKMAADGVTDETTKDGTYIKQNNTVGNNLVSLDTQVKANADAIAEKVNAADVYTKDETDQKVDAANTYTYRKVAAEEKAREAADKALDDRITNVKEYLEKQTSDNYVSKADAAVQDGAIVKAANTIGENVTNLDAALAKETAARIGADKAQDAVIQQVNQNAANGIATLATAYNNEVASREAADNELNERITNEANAIHETTNQLQNDLNTETAAREAGDTALDTRITNVKEYLENQTSENYVSKTDAAVQDGAIVKAAKTIGENVTNLDAALAKETAARIGADKAQDEVIQQVNQNMVDGFNTINKNMADGFTALNQADANEAAAREAADTTLQTNIDNEAAERKAADTVLDDKITAETSARVAADTKLVEAVNSGLSLSNDNVLQKNTTTIDAQGNVTTSKTAANEMILNKGKDNQITLNENGIKVGTNSSVMDKDGVYTGGDTYSEAKAALKSDGSIKGADGKFTVDGTNGNVSTKGSLTAASGTIGNVSMSADGTMTGVKDLTASGKITADSFTDGTATMSNGSLNGVNQINATGNIVTTGNMKAHDITAEGTIKGETINGTTGTFGSLSTTGNASVGGTLTTNGITNTGNATTDTLIVNHNATVGGNLAVTGDITGKSLNVGTGDIKGGQITGTGLDVGAGTIKTTGATETGTLKTTGKAEIGGDMTVTGNTEMKGNLDVKGNLSVEGEFNAKTLSSKLDENNYTTITGGKTQSVNLKMDTATGETKASASTFDETGSNMWAKDDDSIGKSTVTADGISQKLSDTGDNPTTYAESTMSQGTDNKYTMTDTVKDGDKTNVAFQSATESSDVVTDANGNTSTFRQRVDAILQEINNADGDTLTKVEQTDTAITSQIGDGSAIKSVMNADGIANTATGKSITNDAADIINTGTNSVTNQVGSNKVVVDTTGVKSAYGDNTYTTWNAEGITNSTDGNMTNTVGGEMKTTVTGKVTEDYKSDLDTKVGGNETHYVAGNQTNTVSGDRTVNVKGTETENFNAQVTSIKTNQRTSVGGNQTNIVAGNQQNTVSGSKTETVKGSVTEKYGSQATTVDGDQSTHVGGNQSNVVAGDQTNTIIGSKTESVKGAVSETYGSQTTKVNGDQSTTVTGKQTNSITGDQVNTIGGSQTTTVTGDVTEDYKANLSTTVGGNQTTTVTGDSSLTAENITNEAKNKITNKAIDVETDATSSIVQKVTNDAGSNTSTQLSYETKEEMSQADSKTASYLRGAAEEKSQLTDVDKKTTIDTVAGQTNTNITEGKNISNSLQKADQVASSVTDGTNTTVVNQDAKSLASSITDGTKANNSSNTVDKSEQLIKASDTQYSATSKTATKMEDALVSGSNIIDVIKGLDAAGNPLISSAVTDGTTITGIIQNAKDINLSAAGGTITNDAQNITNKAAETLSNSAKNIANTTTEDMTNTIGKNLKTTVGGDMSTEVTGSQSTTVKGNQSNTVEGTLTETVTGKATENYNGGLETTITGEEKHTVNGNQTNNITGNQTNTIGGAQTTTVTGDSSLSAQNITNTASEKITSQIGNDGKVKSEMTADGITNTAEGGTIYNKSKDILNEASGDILNFADGEIGNVATKITNITGDTTVTSDTNGTTFENKAHNTAIKEGTVTKTTISGNTIETGQATMDYAEVMKDLGVHGNATVDGNTMLGKEGADTTLTVNSKSTFKDTVKMEKTLEVDGTSTFNDKVTVTKGGLDVTGGTTTDTLHVTSSSTFDGAATFKDVVTMEKDLSVGGNATVAGSMTASSYKVGDKTYISESGINANNQKVVNVAAGDLSANSTDAVNGAQLYQTNERVTGVENKVNKLDSRVDKVGANAAALANLHPLEFDADSKWNIAAAVGGYKGETATAIGAFYRPNENVMVNVSSSFGTGENMYGGGISLRIGQGGNKARRNATNGLTEREKAMQKQIDSLTSRLDALLSVINPNMSKDFPDVPENHWAYEAVSRLAGNGVIQGYEDGKYHGDRTMTRYEMAEIIYNALSKGAKAEKKLVEEFKPELQAMAAQKKA